MYDKRARTIPFHYKERRSSQGCDSLADNGVAGVGELEVAYRIIGVGINTETNKRR
jgi:hypothetical protein